MEVSKGRAINRTNKLLKYISKNFLQLALYDKNQIDIFDDPILFYIKTPFKYPNGTNIILYITKEYITDYSTTLQVLNIKPDKHNKISKILKYYKCYIYYSEIRMNLPNDLKGELYYNTVNKNIAEYIQGILYLIHLKTIDRL